MQLVLRHSPYRAATIGSTHPPGSEGGNILTQLPALNEGPARDIGLLFNADPREELHSNDDGLHQTPAVPFWSYCQTLRGQEHQPPQEPLEQATTEEGPPEPEPNKEPPIKPPDQDDYNDDL